MSRFLRIAADVVAAAAAIALAIPSGGTSLLAGTLAVSATTATAIAAASAVAAAGINALTTKKPATLANPMAWQSDPQAGVPHVMGRMYTGGQITYRGTWGKDNVNETIQTIYSNGPIKGYESLYVSGVATTVSGDTANIVDRGKMLVSTQLGRQPEASQLGALGPPDFTAQSKLSGLAASSITFVYDTKGGHTFTTEPQTGFVVLGTPVYDPRQDSTYPGGAANGPQRWNDQTTWGFAGYDNPGLKALSYLIGYEDNGNLVIGVGLPISSINVGQLVEMANVCDANGWTIGGVIKSTDNRWQAYTQILQAGGAVPLRNGTVTGCMVNTPKVSLATFERDDVIGDWSVQGCASRRERINAVIPRYMAEQSVVGETTDSKGNVVLQTTVTWGMQPAGVVAVASYATEDGGQRQKGIDYPFVTGVSKNNKAPNQVAQLARYDIENAREFGPISLPMKPRWMGYLAGDVITGGASLTELGLVGHDILILQRQYSPANMTVTMTARSETAAKHPFALGQTTVAPPTPSLTGPPLLPVPGGEAWALTAGVVASPNGTTGAALFLNGASDSGAIDAIVVELRLATGEQDADSDWNGVTTLSPTFSGQLTINSVQDHTDYDVAVSYRVGSGTGARLILGPATPGQTSVGWQAGVTGPGKPEDSATVGAPTGTIVSDRNAETVVANIDVNAQSIIEQALRQDDAQTVLDERTFINGQPIAAYTQSFVDQQTTANGVINSKFSLLGGTNAAGTAWVLNGDTVQLGSAGTLSQQFDEIGAASAALTASVSTLKQAVLNPDGSAKASYTLTTSVVGNNGTQVITGFSSTADSSGSTSFDILAGHFSIVDPNNGNPYTVFTIEDGIVKMHSIEVDTLAINSAIVPARAAATSSVEGTGGDSGASPSAGMATVNVLSTAISMPKAGWIQVLGTLHQTFGNGFGGHQPWAVKIQVDGIDVPESVSFGTGPGDSVVMAGSVLVGAGGHSITMLYGAYTSVSAANRSLFASGYVNTE